MINYKKQRIKNLCDNNLRRLKVNMKADVNIWASEFAEAYGVDGRCEKYTKLFDNLNLLYYI